MSNWFDDPRRPHNTRDPRPISPFTDSVGWSSPRPRPVALAPAASRDGLVAVQVAAPTTLDTLVAPTSSPTALDALVAAPSTPTALDTLVGPAPVARVALVRRPVDAATDDACAPRMTMFQEKP